MRHSVLNAEAFTALLFLLILLVQVRSADHPVREIRISDSLLVPLIAAISFFAFLPALGMPLLHDSYGHVYLASRESLPSVLRTFIVHPTHGDFFFRPLGYLSFWIDDKWASYSPFRWHLWSVSMHILNALLVFVVARQLSLGKLGASFAALFFALHGSRPEAVAWVAARFDLLAACFALLTLICFLRFVATGQRLWFVPMAAFTTAALLSKESAYCLPLLVACVGFLNARSARILAPFALVSCNCAVVFMYRSYLLHGIGGYGAESGSPAILQFSLLRTLNALLLRQWAVLFFPVNWSVSLGPAMWLAMVFALIALVAVLVVVRGSRIALGAALAMTMGAALPVQHLLLIGSDLSGSRVLYLPVLGLALFWGLIIQNVPDRRVQFGVAALLLLFQLTALEHNLKIWIAVARLSQRSCSFLAAELARDDSPITVTEAPATWKGVYFLNNSLEACILLNSNGKLKEIPSVASEAAGAKRVYRWDDSTLQITRAK